MRIRTVFKHVCIVINALFLICNAARAQDIIPAERRIAWDPGIPGGIPSRTTICANVKNSPYNAVGNDIADDTTAIQQAITDCPAGQVVYIPEGMYRLTGGIPRDKGLC